MNRKQHSGIFMMEMIMVVFFFILCASICILVFVRADRMSREASDLNQSVLIAQSVAEVWKAEGPEGLETHFDAEDVGSGRYVYMMDFGKDGGQTEQEVIYTAILAGGDARGSADVTVIRNGETIYTLEVSRHDRSSFAGQTHDGEVTAGR